MSASLLVQHYARTFWDIARSRGIAFERLCDGMVFDGKFDDRKLALIARNLKWILNDELAGLSKHPLRAGSFPIMCEFAVLSDSLREALERAFRLYALVTRDITFSLEVSGPYAVLNLRLTYPEYDLHSVLPEWWMIFWHRFSQWLIGLEIPVEAVEFMHKSSVEHSAYAAVLGAQCKFDSKSTLICLPASFLDRKVVRNPEELQRFLTPEYIDLVSVDGVEENVPSVVRTRLRAHLREHQTMPKLEDLARDLGMCAQTLRRRLEAKGFAYRDLKAEVRREVAIRCLNDARMPLREISIRSGFSEPNSFARALRSWAGVSPTHFRELIAAGAAPSAVKG